MRRNARSTKWRLHWGSIRGSNLNLGWSKCGVWLVDQWVPTSLCVCVFLTIEYTLRALGIIISDACLVIVFVWGFGVSIILIDPFDYPHVLTLLVVWLLCLPWHVHYSCCLSHSLWHDCFFWSYVILFIMEHAIITRYSSWLACV